MKKVGEHVTIDFLGVKRDYSPDFYNKVIYKIAKKAKIEVLNISEKVFKPQGYTCLALLAESHISFHTFPENRIIMLKANYEEMLARAMEEDRERASMHIVPKLRYI